MFRLNSRLLYTRAIQRPINNRIVQTRRSYTSDDGSKGGKGLTWAAILALAAGSYIFLSRRETPPTPLSDPYNKTKENLGQLQEKVVQVGNDVRKEYGDDLNHEVNKLGDHLKSTASIVSDAAQTAYKDLKTSTKDEVEAVIGSLKDETTKLSHELKVEANKFRSEHHLKEGDRPAEDIVADTRNDTIQEVSRISVTGKKIVQDVNEAAFQAASTLGNEIKQKANEATDYLSKETENLKSSIKNPMVEEKRSSGRTKTSDELRLEEKAKNLVHDTSVLVEKDTNKVKDLWNAKEEHNKHTYGDSSLSASWEDLKEDAQDAFRKETLTAKEAWKEGKDTIESEAHRLKTQANDSWHDLADEAKKQVDKSQSSWSSLKENVKEDAQDLLHKVEDAASNVTGIYKKEAEKASTEWDKTHKDAQTKAKELKRSASDAVSTTADDLSSSVESLKKEGEDWLNKGDVNELKNKAEKKVDEAKNWAQDGVDGLKGSLKNAQDEVSATLKDHENLTPAEEIVEDAKRHKI